MSLTTDPASADSAGNAATAQAMPQSFAVIGAGAWGTALAVLACRAGRMTGLYARRPDHAATLRQQRENARYLPRIDLPPALTIQDDLALSLASAEAVLYAQPAQHFRDFCRQAKPHLRSEAALVICAKGIELGTGQLLTEIAAAELPDQPVAVLSGPSFAAEAALGLPTAVCIATQLPGLAERLMLALSHGGFRPYGAADPIGVEVAGATKNVLA
ncbi:MAG TPA: 2-dehydropantoate 2-reductase N-terminal domain-containing protein, partial [Dongiaceae bacterium]|nr:2-dehydropantoate 2-reductase N-terminal domain-containing protein [Dongiaceae bacterium]